MANKMFMGIPTSHMQWVPCPSIDSSITRKRYVERIQFQNGGGDVARSPQYQMEYNLTMSGPAHEMDGIDAINRFASGYYGNDYIYVAHPTSFETNLFPASWSSPGLIEQGWKNIHPSTTPTFSNTAANSYNQPARTATWTEILNGPSVTLIIPPGYTLNLGVSGSATGNGVVKMRRISVDNDTTVLSNLTLLSATGSTRMNTTVSGSTYCAVVLYLSQGGISTPADSVSITSAMAQLYPTGTTPTLPTSHIMGQGSTGLMFADDAFVETYSYMYPPRKGISTTLVEVEAWR